MVVPYPLFCHEKQRAKLHNRLKGVGADMIAAMQKENFKEKKVTEKFSIISKLKYTCRYGTDGF